MANPEIAGKLMTHEWRVYVTGQDGDDKFHQFVDKVVFYLDPSFKDTRRVSKVRRLDKQ